MRKCKISTFKKWTHRNSISTKCCGLVIYFSSLWIKGEFLFHVQKARQEYMDMSWKSLERGCTYDWNGWAKYVRDVPQIRWLKHYLNKQIVEYCPAAATKEEEKRHVTFSCVIQKEKKLLDWCALQIAAHNAITLQKPKRRGRWRVFYGDALSSHVCEITE